MDALMNKIRNTYDFTEYELKIIRYVITALLYDLSKLILLAVMFSYLGFFPYFLCALIPFCLLRSKNGGIHTKSYWTCLLLTVLVFIPTVMILPVTAPLTPILRIGLMIPCAITEYRLGPLLSHREVKLDKGNPKKPHCFLSGGSDCRNSIISFSRMSVFTGKFLDGGSSHCPISYNKNL